MITSTFHLIQAIVLLIIGFFAISGIAYTAYEIRRDWNVASEDQPGAGPSSEPVSKRGGEQGGT